MREQGLFHPIHYAAKPLRVALAGLGAVGAPLAHSLLRGAVPGVQLVATAARRRKLWLKGTQVECLPDPLLLAHRADIDVLISCLGGLNPEQQVVSQALSNGKHVITPNSTLIAAYGRPLSLIAQQQRTHFRWHSGLFGDLPLQFLPGIHAASLFGDSGFETMLQTLQTEHMTTAQTVSVKPALYNLVLLRALLFGQWSSTQTLHATTLPTLKPQDVQLAVRLGLTFAVGGRVSAHSLGFGLHAFPNPTAFAPAHTTGKQLTVHTLCSDVSLSIPSLTITRVVQGIQQDLALIQTSRPQIMHPTSVAPAAQNGPQHYFLRCAEVAAAKLKNSVHWVVQQQAHLPHSRDVGVILTSSNHLTDLQQHFGPETLIIPVGGAHPFAVQDTRHTDKQFGYA